METQTMAEDSMMRKLQPLFYDWEWEVLLGQHEFRRQLAEAETVEEASELVELGNRLLAQVGP
jgi:hypothetical protein